jgi:asparagine synthase (glutamine-hydrolysing)
LKIKGPRVKHILKEAVRGLIPDEIIDRPKEGFVLPINDWLLGGLREHVYTTLAPQRLARHGLLNQEVVAAMLEQHYRGEAQHGARIWNLMSFQFWWEQYIA